MRTILSTINTLNKFNSNKTVASFNYDSSVAWLSSYPLEHNLRDCRGYKI